MSTMTTIPVTGTTRRPRYTGALAVGIALNATFVVVGVVYGVLSHSVALIADAGHNLGDVLGLAAALIANVLVQRRPSQRYTYGLRGSTILGGAVQQPSFCSPSPAPSPSGRSSASSSPRRFAGTTVMIVAAIGIAINAVSAILFMSGRKHDLNIRGAFLHMAGDALVSVGVVIAGLAIVLTAAGSGSIRR